MSGGIGRLQRTHLASVAKLAFEAGYPAYNEAALVERLARERCVDWAVGEPPEGVALFERVLDEAELHLLVVAPPARRRGLGTRLLDVGIEHLRRDGVTALFLEVSHRNGPALALYRSRGFEEAGRRPRYYPDGTDALVLRSRLGSGSRPL